MHNICDLSAPVQLEMDRCRNDFSQLLAHENPYLNDILAFVATYKGKMLRPLLTLLCGKLLGQITENTLLMAVAEELFHTASLLHDDIVDESDERRGSESVNRRFGNKSAVLVGDYLLALSMSCVARTGEPRMLTLLSECAQRMADGELLQLHNSVVVDSSEDDYFRVIESKTGSLFAVCTQAAAVFAGASEEVVDAMRRFGLLIGNCFQMQDDILDFVGGVEMGKPIGNDLMEGKATLPLLFALRQGANEDIQALAHKLKGPGISPMESSQLIKFTVENGGVDYARTVMNRFADDARRLLLPYAASPVYPTLCAFVDFLIERSH